MSDDLPVRATAKAQRAALQVLDTAAAATTLAALEAHLGGRAQLLEALHAAPDLDDDLAYVVNLLADPRSDARSLASICRAGGITQGELLEAFKRGVFATMTVKAVATIAARTPAVVDDVMTRAAPHLGVCSLCRGSLVVQGRPCACVGTATPGREEILPDLDRQKLALDLAKLLPQKGAAVVIDQSDRRSLSVDASPAGFAKLLAATDAILHRRALPTRATPTETIDADLDPDEAPAPPVPSPLASEDPPA